MKLIANDTLSQTPKLMDGIAAAEIFRQNVEKLWLLQLKSILSAVHNVDAYLAGTGIGIPALTLATMFIPLAALFIMMGYHTVLALAYILVDNGSSSATNSKKVINNGVTLTVVVPIKNEPIELVVKSIEHGLKNFRKSNPVEVLVVSDDTIGYVEELLRKIKGSRVRVVKRSGVRGRSSALDLGYGLAKGRYVLYLDVDSRVDPSTIENLLKALEESVVVVIPWRSYCSRRTKLCEAIAFMTTIYSFLYYKARSALNLFVFPLGSGTAYRKSLLEKLGGWGPGIVQDDIWMGIRLASTGLKPKVLSEGFVDVLAPSKYTSLKIQQCRWAYGTSEALSRGLKALLTSPLRPLEKLEALLYLLQPAASIAMALTVVLAAAAAVVDRGVELGVLMRSPIAAGAAATGAALIALYYASIATLADRLGYSSKWRVLCMLGRAAAFYSTLTPLLALYSILGFARLGIPYQVTPKASHEDPLGTDRYLLIAAATTLILLVLALLSGNIVSTTVMLALHVACIYTILNHSREVSPESFLRAAS
ncbi:MAG: hypothetical protein DRO39_02670 [Thermoprotei archaeon]|nr:MAG: hypothetical protein DRO39_02670 [Thermoprotei archaeon]